MDGRPPGFVYWFAMRHAVRLLLLLPVLAAVALSCDKATPTAPSGSTLAISASPSKIGLTGTSTITVIGRQPNGSAMREGTEIRLSASIGSIEPLVLMNNDGVATATLRGDGRKGAATVAAQTGTASGGGGGAAGTGSSTGSLSVSTTVQIGETDDTKPTLIVSASPSTVPVGGSSRITIIARNSDGSAAAAGQTVILTTTFGTLNPSRPTTQSDGTATSTLNVGNESGTAKVTAILGTSEAATVDVTIRDAATDIELLPDVVNLSPSGGSLTFQAFVINSQNQPIAGAAVNFSSIGTLEGGNVAFTDSTGTATKKITYTQDDLRGLTTFNVKASTPGSTGSLIDDTSKVNVQ